jgi:hypothetical protein
MTYLQVLLSTGLTNAGSIKARHHNCNIRDEVCVRRNSCDLSVPVFSMQENLPHMGEASTTILKILSSLDSFLSLVNTK